MAKNTKGDGSLEANGVTVVTPDNIGAGVWFNPVTQKYEVKISGAEGNLITLHKNGLYYGIKAKPSLENLFVDAVNGVDQNPSVVVGAGTRANPLKTVHYAMSLAELGTTRNVLIRENQDHLVPAEKGQNIVSGVVNIQPYGEVYDHFIANSPESTIAVFKLIVANQAPRLVFTGLRTWANRDNTNGGYIYTVWHAKGTTINLWGLEVINDLSMTLDPINGMGADKLSIKQAARLQGSNGATYFINMCRIKSRGTTKSNVGSAFVNHATGLNRCGFFHGTVCTFTLYSINNDLSTDCTCCIVADRGWNEAISSATNLNIRTLTESNQRFIGKGTNDKAFDSIGENKLLRVPNIDTKTEYFL